MTANRGAPASGVPFTLRMTAFPGVVMSEPPVATAEIDGPHGPWLELSYAGVGAIPEHAVFYEVADTDPGDVDSLVGLTHALAGDVVPTQRERWRDVLSPHRGLVRTDPLDVYAQIVSTHAEKIGLPPVVATDLEERLPAHGPLGNPAPSRVHMAEIALRVWSLQTVTRALTGQIETTNRGWGNSGADFPAQASSVEADWLAGAFGLMVRTFSPSLTLHFPDGDISARPGQPSTALEVAALQLANSLAVRDGYKICPRCRRVFTQQRGRARYSDSHHRSDAIYCSHRCSQAAAQQRHRQRKRASESDGG